MSLPDARLLDESPGRLRGLAPGKLNLFLEVIARRPDGYHELSTVFHEIDLADEIEIALAPDSDDHLACLGHPLDVAPADNLALRAVRAFRGWNATCPPCHVRIMKRIPPGTGLGGGSSDAAFVLDALARLTGSTPPMEQMHRLARDLGSDVPFFLAGGSAVGRGRGDELEPITDLPRFTFVLALPAFSLSTATVYGHVDLIEPRADVSSFVEGMRRRDARGTANGVNRLERAACVVEPRLARLLEDFRRRSEAAWRMTGSGSALFAMVSNREMAERVARQVAPLGSAEVHVVRVFVRHPLEGT